VNADLLATSGNILIRNTQDLNVVTKVAASSAPGGFAEIDAEGAAAPSGDLAVLERHGAGIGRVLSRRQRDNRGGRARAGSVLATVEADVAAGVRIRRHAATGPSIAYGPPAGSSTGTIDILALSTFLAAHGAACRRGQHHRVWQPSAPGSSPASPRTVSREPVGSGARRQPHRQSRSFSTVTGFLLRDGSSLSIVGPVTDPTNINCGRPPGGGARLRCRRLVLEARYRSSTDGHRCAGSHGNVYEVPVGNSRQFHRLSWRTYLVAAGGSSPHRPW
jgi:hypothetical protein